MSQGQWYFSKQHLGVTVNSSAFRHTLSGSGFDSSESLAREAIQNSVDAAPKGKKPLVRFHIKTLTGADKAAFVDALAVNDTEWTLRKKCEFYEKAGLGDLISPKTPLRLLYIDDFNTDGLYGDPYSHDRHVHSHLRRLLLELGNDSKAHGSSVSGGSFGFGGKSVFLNSGRHSIVVAFSVFDPKRDGNRGASAQLMGVGYMGDHEVGHESYTAYPEFSKRSDSPVGRSPWIDEEAVALAQELGFVARQHSETGASILIPGTTVTIDAIRKAIELWWWPRLVSNQLDIELFEDGVAQEDARPRRRLELKPYIECFQAIEGGASKRIEVMDIPNGAESIGRLALRLREDAPPDEDDEEEPEDWSAINGVALIRSPRMVVEYHRGAKRGAIPPICQGVFVASQSEKVDNALKLSENAAHNVWDSKSERLDSVEGGAILVQELLKAIRKKARDYVKKAEPPAPPQNFRMPLLENFLAEALRSGRKGPVVTKAEPMPVSMKNIDARTELRGGQLYLVGAPR